MPKLKDEEERRARILELRAEGASYSEIAKELDVSRGFIRSTLRAAGEDSSGEEDPAGSTPSTVKAAGESALGRLVKSILRSAFHLAPDDKQNGRVLRAMVLSEDGGEREVSIGFESKWGEWTELQRVQVSHADVNETLPGEPDEEGTATRHDDWWASED